MRETVRRVKSAMDTEVTTVRAALRILERDVPERHKWVVRDIIRQWINNKEVVK